MGTKEIPDMGKFIGEKIKITNAKRWDGFRRGTLAGAFGRIVIADFYEGEQFGMKDGKVVWEIRICIWDGFLIVKKKVNIPKTLVMTELARYQVPEKIRATILNIPCVIHTRDCKGRKWLDLRITKDDGTQCTQEGDNK